MSELNRHIRILNKLLRRRGLWYDPRFMLEHWTEKECIHVQVTGDKTSFLIRYRPKGNRLDIWEITLRYRLQHLKKMSKEYDTKYLRDWRNKQLITLIEPMAKRMGYDNVLPFRLQMIDLFKTYDVKIDYEKGENNGNPFKAD